MPTGTIRLTATPQGKRLDLMGPNASPPPETVSVLMVDPVPAWIWEAVVGNAGATCTIILDPQGAPASVTVG